MYSKNYQAYLDDKHEYEDEDEGGVEVGDVEGGAEAPDQRVAANHAGQQHGGHLGAQARHQADVFIRKIRNNSKW